ncbi:MAG: DUF1297 domain-containing protein [Candidatus Hodarchaeota archaeon]
MPTRKEILEVADLYDLKNIGIATLGSHSALNILKGAKDESIGTICICEKDRKKIYDRFPIVDRYILVDHFKDILDESIQKQLRDLSAIVIPHGSFNAYVGSENLEDYFLVPIFGNRILLTWESHRHLQDKWLRDAGIRTPKIYDAPSDIDTTTIIKFPRAKGGRGYFIAGDEKTYHQKAKEMLRKGLITKEDLEEPQIQEYVVGAPIYLHYFYSPLNRQLEFMGADRRYESSIDGVSRIPAKDQLEIDLESTYTVVANFIITLRESLLPQVFDIGEKTVKASKKIAQPGLIGAFCLETIATENLELIVFEISSRIVAGMNVGIGSSPYSYVLYNEPMYVGRRIAREVKRAIQLDRLSEVLT